MAPFPAFPTDAFAAIVEGSFPLLHERQCSSAEAWLFQMSLIPGCFSILIGLPTFQIVLLYMCTSSLRYEHLKHVSQVHVHLLTIPGREPDIEKALGRRALMMDQSGLVKEIVCVENSMNEHFLVLYHVPGSEFSDKRDEMK